MEMKAQTSVSTALVLVLVRR